MVVPISEASAEYAQEVRRTLRNARFFVDVDLADNKMQKKVREAQLAQYNYILVSSWPLKLCRGIPPVEQDPSQMHACSVPSNEVDCMHAMDSTWLFLQFPGCPVDSATVCKT